MMGAADLEDTKPVRKVRITQGLWLGECEVTMAQWEGYVHETGGQAG